MGYHPRIETPNIAAFSTVRSRNSELWLVNNEKLERAILGYIAKFTKRYRVKLYAFGIEGNHLHSTALFPECNRSAFKRDLNSCVARAVPRYVPTYPGGSLWARRYSSEYLPGNEDVEKQFFYTVLQPVSDGLVDSIFDYPEYNCFSDAVHGRERKFEVINWAAYNEARRWKVEVNISDFTETVTLKYERLPGYEHLSQQEYAALMYKKLQSYTKEAIIKRNKPAVGAQIVRNRIPGAKPKQTKKSGRYSHRPRVLSACPKRREQCTNWYFKVYFEYKEASRIFRSGKLSVKFPPGTYRPPHFTNQTESVAILY